MKKSCRIMLSLLLLLGLSLGLCPAAGASDDMDFQERSRYMEELGYALKFGNPTESGSVLYEKLARDGVKEPKSGSFIDAPWVSYVLPASGKMVKGCASPGGKVLQSLPSGTSVLVLAEENGESCVLVMGGGQVVWVKSSLLEEDYYGQQQPLRKDIRAQLESWKDVEQIHSGCGSVFALKKDGSTLSLRCEENGIDISRWGKLSYLYASELEVMAIGTDGQAYYYCSGHGYPADVQYTVELPDDYSDEMLSYTYQDVRFLDGLTLLSYDGRRYGHGLGIRDGEVFRLHDGCLTDHSLFYNAVLCRDGGKGDWGLYVPAAWVDNEDRSREYVRYPLDKSGKFDTDAGERRSAKACAALERKLLRNAVDVSYSYYGEAYSVLFADGSFLLGGMYGLYPDEGSYDWSFLTRSFRAVDLIGLHGLVLDNGTVVCFGSSLAPALKDWKNVVACREDLGFTKDGRLLTDVWDEWGLSYPEEIREWKDIRDAVRVVLSEEQTGYAVLGVTKDGKIRIAGELPPDGTSTETEDSNGTSTGAEDSEEAVPIILTEYEGQEIYLVAMENVNVARAATRFMGINEQLDFYGQGNHYSTFVFPQPVEDCVLLSIGASITPMDDHDNEGVVWSLVLREKESQKWYLIDSVDTVPLETTTMVFMSEEPVTWDAVSVIPTEAPNGHSAFMLGINVGNSYVGFSTAEAAVRFAESLFP